jgi:hypothetical protein
MSRIWAKADLGRAVGHGPNHSADQATSEAATSCCAFNRPVRSVRLSSAMDHFIQVRESPKDIMMSKTLRN